MSKLDIVTLRPGHVIALWGPLVISIHESVIDITALEELRLATNRALAQHGATSGLTVLRHNVPMSVDQAFRRCAERVTEEFRETTVAAAVTIVGHDLRSAFARALVTGLNIIAHTPTPRVVFREVNEAIHWLAQTDIRLKDDTDALTLALNETSVPPLDQHAV